MSTKIDRKIILDKSRDFIVRVSVQPLQIKTNTDVILPIFVYLFCTFQQFMIINFRFLDFTDKHPINGTNSIAD